MKISSHIIDQEYCGKPGGRETRGLNEDPFDAIAEISDKECWEKPKSQQGWSQSAKVIWINMTSKVGHPKKIRKRNN